jgi:chromosome segregation ATPase
MAAAGVVFVAGAGAGYYLKGLEHPIAPEHATTAKTGPQKAAAATAGSSAGVGQTIPASIVTAPSCDAEQQATVACKRQLASATAAASRAGVVLKDQLITATKKAERAEADATAAKQSLAIVSDEVDTLELRARNLQAEKASCEGKLNTANGLSEELKRKSDGLARDVVEVRQSNEALRARNADLAQLLAACKGPG